MGRLRNLTAAIEEITSLEDRALIADALTDTANRFTEVRSGTALRPFPEEHRVPSCESQAYVWALPAPDGGIELEFAVENPQGISARALAVLLKENLSGGTVEEIDSVPEEIIYTLFGKTLASARAAGLKGMIRLIKEQARLCKG